jgi:hypothetical protein
MAGSGEPTSKLLAAPKARSPVQSEAWAGHRILLASHHNTAALNGRTDAFGYPEPKPRLCQLTGTDREINNKASGKKRAYGETPSHCESERQKRAWRIMAAFKLR